MKVSSCDLSKAQRVSFRRECCRLPGKPPESSARRDLAVVVSRPVSIFLRVLTGFFVCVEPQ
jgi:hypothetical protein